MAGSRPQPPSAVGLDPIAITSLPMATLALPVLPAAAGAAFAWSLVLAGAVVILSVVPLGLARSKADFTLADLAAPRAMFERLPAWGKRAAWAHQNCFEAFGLHAPAALLALVADVGTPAAVAAAWLHPAFRLAYLGAYVGNVPPLRGLCWIGGLLCTALLYSEGLRAVIRG